MKYHLKLFFLLFFYCSSQCQLLAQQNNNLGNLWTKINGVKPENTVFVFLATECPLCKNYSPVLREIADNYKEYQIVGVFPGKTYTAAQVSAYKKDYKINFKTVLDPKMELTKLLNATVTPQAIVLSKLGKIVYSGAIDDKVISLGQQKTVTTKHYLKDALNELREGKEVQLAKTKPIGCYINDF